jgi:hypothetical protein
MTDVTPKARSPLPRLLSEFAVIVLGVLVALAADGWMSDRADRAAEREYLERLLADVEADRAENRVVVEVHTRALEASHRLLEVIETGRLRSVAPEVLVPMVITASEQRSPDYGRATYQEMLSSGRLGLIRSREVRLALAEYERVIGEFAGAWVSIRGAFHQMRNRSVHPSVMSAFIRTCFGELPVDPCILDLKGWPATSLVERLEGPETIGDIYQSMAYEGSANQIVTGQLDPAGAALETALREALGSATP